MKNLLIDVRTRPDLLDRLRAVPGVAVALAEPSPVKRPLPADLLRDRHVLFCSLPPANLEEMNALELVQITSVGYEKLYGLGLAERGVRVCNARGIYETTIAEWNVAMMVNLARDLRGMVRNQEHAVWDQAARFQNEVRGRLVGLWGYGGIGRETARLAKAMGMRVHALTRRGVSSRENTYRLPGVGDPDGTLPDRVFSAGQELEFLAGLDFLVLSLPQTPATTGLLGERELRALPRGAFILNPARGPIIQEQALLNALRNGWVAGAALDTHYQSPLPADHPLWRFPNVIITPHVSGSDQGPYYLDRVWDVLLQNVERFLAGRPLLNELTPAELKGE
jgi:phosphoglycerate dehydrogenase-like enzyme